MPTITSSSAAGCGFAPQPEGNAFNSLLKQYERVVFESLVTSFGLDSFIKDRLGGDVDTVLNVRKGEAGGGYKSAKNQRAYENRGEYNYYQYHDGNKNFKQTKDDAKREYRSSGEPLSDAYTGGELHFFNSKHAPKNKQASLDHVKSASGIHNDAGRLLAGLDGANLANSDDNLKFTNFSLNSSMKADDIPDYIKKHPELPEETKAKMLEHYNNADKSYEKKINTYYARPAFWKDAGIAAAKTGGKMALRQVLGLVMTEVWFSVMECMARARDGFAEKLKAIADGVKQGFANVKAKFGQLLSRFGEGAVSGLLASLSTTICNIFFTTAKNAVKIIRQVYVYIVQAVKVLVFNPEKLPFGERIQAVMKILATGASVVLGVIVQEAVHKALLPHIGLIPFFGETVLYIVSIFAGTLCTGFMTVSLLYYIDNDPFNGFLRAINKTISSYERQARLFEEYAAKLAGLDTKRFERKISLCMTVVSQLEAARDDRAVNAILRRAMVQLNIPVPWGDVALEVFMQDKISVLHFK